MNFVIDLFIISWYYIIGLFSLYKGTIKDNDAHQSATVHGIVCFVNGFCCILQLAKLDTIITPNASIKYLRYIEWFICVPLMVLEVALSSKFEGNDIILVVFLSSSFCVSGSIAAFATTIMMKIFMGVQGSIFCIIMLYRMWKLVLEKRSTYKNIELHIAFSNLIMMTIIWPVFVITWGLGQDVYGFLSIHQELLVHMILSIVLKTFALSYALISTSKRVENYIENVTLCFGST